MRSNRNCISDQWFVILISSILIIMTACGVKKRPVETLQKQGEEVVINRSQPKDFLSRYIVYSFFKGSSKVDIKSPSINHSVDIHTKSIYNKSTHSSVRAGLFGVTMEAVQLFLNKDSIVALDKTNTQYYHIDWGKSEELLKMPLTLEMMQNLFVGNPPLISDKYESYELTDEKMVITQKFSPYMQTLTYNAADGKLDKVELSVQNSSYHLTVGLSEYRADGHSGIVFASSQQWSITNGVDNYHIQWKYDEFQFNVPLDIQFSIPFRYRQAQIK